MTDLIKAMNPTAALTTEQAARDAARVSAVGMVLGAISQAAAGWYASTDAGIAAARGMVEQMLGQAPTVEEAAQQAQIGLIVTAVVVVLQLGLAAIQWRKPNGVLPLIFLILVIWGLGTASLGLFLPAISAAQPFWLTVLTVILLASAAILHVAGIRGASALDKLRTAAQ